jgi:hypothetical protein
MDGSYEIECSFNKMNGSEDENELQKQEAGMYGTYTGLIEGRRFVFQKDPDHHHHSDHRQWMVWIKHTYIHTVASKASRRTRYS